jgi:triacylglycerol lipase
MGIDAHAGHIITDVAKFSLRIGSHATRSGVAVGEEIERPAVAAMRAAGIEVESWHTDAGRKVYYDFFAGVTPEILNPGGTLPGANQWNRPMSKAHPNPVILMHGTAGGAQTNWGLYVPLLVQQGFSPFTLTFGAIKTAPWPLSALGGMAPLEDSAAEFGAFVDKVLDATGADKVDVVGHSQGTLVPGYYAKLLGGAEKINTYVSLAPLWQGTAVFTNKLAGPIEFRIALDVAHHVHFAAAEQMMRGSEFLAALNSGGKPYVPGIRYVNISSRYDEFVRPYSSGQVPAGPDDDVVNIIVQDTCHHDFSDHLAIAGSPRAATMVLNALDGSDDPARGPRQVPQKVVPPILG